MEARRTEPRKIDAWPGAASLLDSIPEGWHTSGQAAVKVGRSKDTIVRWHKEGQYVPSGYMERGKLVVWLYSDHDILQMQALATDMKPGRNKKEHEHDEEDR